MKRVAFLLLLAACEAKRESTIDVPPIVADTDSVPSGDEAIEDEATDDEATDDEAMADDDSPATDGAPATPARLTVNEGVVTHTLAVGERTLLLTLARPLVVTVRAPGATLVVGDRTQGEPGFWGPLPLAAGEHTLVVTATGEVSVTLEILGPALEAIEESRSLVWRDAALIDAPELVGLARVMRAISADAHGGRLLAAWLDRFRTTAHSERAGPAMLLEALSAEHGADASTWDLDALPFVVTAVHNRLDLRDADDCGELRVSVACSAPAFQPFHVLFRFRQMPLVADVSPTGVTHCAATALRWAALSSASSEAFVESASDLLDEAVSSSRFIDAETVEFIVSPWEWRQWDLSPNPDASTRAVLPLVFENPPLFQTVDAPRLNEPGPERDDFIAFVEANGAALASRSLELPARFRSQSARLNAGVPWRPLDLMGVSSSTLEANPTLRQQIEIVGCPACHATDAEFVQTRPDRSFSPFYVKELLARADALVATSHGAAPRRIFGPLQRDPMLPP